MTAFGACVLFERDPSAYLNNWLSAKVEMTVLEGPTVAAQESTADELVRDEGRNFRVINVPLLRADNLLFTPADWGSNFDPNDSDRWVDFIVDFISGAIQDVIEVVDSVQIADTYDYDSQDFYIYLAERFELGEFEPLRYSLHF